MSETEDDRFIMTPQEFDWPEPGLSLRDWFAGQALVAVVGATMADPDVAKTVIKMTAKHSGDPAAIISYRYADAMIKAREASQ